ncbi:cuticle protein AM1199-like [Hyalella azteca]|uniref:Cuticle protein AM1199-like n=1 Tax=Hyalella azteca TaxID=294128 RepID=A0A8B7PFW6_HYAAZ|nr:cuticle protein AM1199-like [Hyalella azteca]
MKMLLVAVLAGIVCSSVADQKPVIPAHFRIIEDNRIYPENGIFSFDFKTENGIVREEAGNEHLVRTGIISYPMPNGETFFLKFVADATGYKVESPFLPQVPAFPHPIPPHSLRQIERAERERAEAARRRAEQSGEYRN